MSKKSEIFETFETSENFKNWFLNDSGGDRDTDSTEFIACGYAWEACKEAVLKKLEPFEGEHVCDVIDMIKRV